MKILSGVFKGRVLSSTEGPGLRPAMAKVRAALFSMLEARGVDWEDSRVLDLFAGLGSLGFEAASRGSRDVWFVEKGNAVCRTLKLNMKSLGLESGRCRVVCQDVRSYLAREAEKAFDVVFVDPPYGLKLLAPSLKLLVQGGYLGPDSLVAAEIESRVELEGLALPEQLEQTADRLYGQTRILIWKTRTSTPQFIPEPSIP